MSTTPGGIFDYVSAPYTDYAQGTPDRPVGVQEFQRQVETRILALAPGSGTGISDPGSNGILARVASGVTTARSLVQPAAGLTISNNDGLSGNPTFALANDLAALEALSSTGWAKRTGTDAWSVSATISASDIASGQALSKADDTNISLTLGGSYATALLAAASITVAWAGVLSVARGGTGASTFASNGVLYGNGSSAVQALAVNATATNKFLTQSSSLAPAWNTIVASDLPGSFAGFANPSAQVGLSTVNGSATTAMRSDAAPALSQAISPTWSNSHTFSAGLYVSGLRLLSESDNYLKLYSGNNSVGALHLMRNDGTSWGYFYADGSGVGVLNGAGQWAFLMGGSAGATNTYIDFYISGGQKLRLSGSNGDLAFAASNPTITASSYITFPGGAYFNSGTVYAEAAIQARGGIHNDNGAYLTIAGGTTGKTYFSGNVGFLTTNPSQPVEVAGNVFINSGTANLFLRDTSTGWQSASSTVVTPQINNSIRSTSFTSGLVGWGINGPGDAEFNNITTRGELRASVFKVSEISATAGTFGVFYSASTLNADTTIPAGGSWSFDAKNSDAGGMLFGVNDIIRFKAFSNSGGYIVADSWATITARTNHSTYSTYTATFASGSSTNTFRAGTSIVDYGPSGTGFITMSADGTVGSSPNLTMGKHSGSPWSSFTTLLRLGNLNGSYGYASDVYGFATGSYGVANQPSITIETTNGIRMIGGSGGTTQLMQLDTSGNILVGQTGAGQSNVFISAGAVDLRMNTTSFIHLASNGSGYFANTNISWNTSGDLTVAANATIAGWSVSSTQLSSGSVQVASGADIPNTAGAWFGRGASGYYGLRIGDGTKSLVMLANNSTLDPYFYASDGSVYRVVIGGMNYAGWPGGSSTGYGMKIGDSGNNLLVEFSNTRNQIAGLTIAYYGMWVGTGNFANSNTAFYVDWNGYFSLKDKLYWDGSTLTINGGGTFSGALSAASGTFAGSLSAATGTFAGSLSAATGSFAGSLSAATGSFAGSLSAASGTFAGSLTAASGTITGTLSVTTGALIAGGGNVTLDSNGLSLVGGTGGANRVSWSTDLWIGAVTTAAAVLQLNSGSATTTQLGAIQMNAHNSNSSHVVQFDLDAAAFTGTVSYAALYGTNLSGLIVGANATPSSMLEVRGQTRIVNDSHWAFGNGTRFQASTTGNYYELFINADNSNGLSAIQSYQENVGVAVLALNPVGGSIGIGVSGPSTDVDVNGNVRFRSYGAGTAVFDASGNISSSSDERLKFVHGWFTKGLEALRPIHPVVYSWKPGFYTDDIATKYVGFTTQNVGQVNALPEAVFRGTQYENLWERGITAALVNAVHELDETDDYLKQKLNIALLTIKQLEDTVDALTAEVHKLKERR